MKVKSKGPAVAFLKRKAKSLKKELGLTHTTSLDLVVKDYGFTSWNDYNNQTTKPLIAKHVPSRPKAPYPLALDYHNLWNGTIIGQHPNAKMAPRRHKQVGNLLQDLLGIVEFHKRAKSVIQDIIALMDTWLGCEYTEAEMQNEEFNLIYYGKNTEYLETRPTRRQQQKSKRWLLKAKQIIDQNYHDCRPLEKLHERFELADNQLDKWPKSARFPGSKPHRKQVVPGTFVRLIGKNQIGVVFNQPYGEDSVVGYSDGGIFHRGRHEVSVLRKQLDLADFRPMRLILPYGKWICDDGREVLFNRDYTPIWERRSDNEVESISPEMYITHNETVFYFDDATAPYYGNARTHEVCLSVLQEWGVAEKKSQVIELLPAALASGNAKLLSPKGTS